MKEGRRAGGITAGPESKVLDGATWDEAQAMQEGKTVDHVDYKVKFIKFLDFLPSRDTHFPSYGMPSLKTNKDF